jgi:hypothetical protein
MQMRYLDFDQKIHTISTIEIREILAFSSYLASATLKDGIGGLLYYEGTILPIKGVVPSLWEATDNYDERPWIMVLKDHAQVIYGLPQFDPPEAKALKGAA